MNNPSLKFGILENKYLLGSFVLGAILQIVVVVLPSVAEIFKLVPLTGEQWLYTVLISILPIVIMEVQKKLNEIKFGRRIYTKQENQAFER